MNKLIRLQSSTKYKLLFSLIVFFPFLVLLFSGKVIYWGTASLQFIPWDQFLYDNILEGNFPLWNPYNGMGVPFVANHQSAVFYPLNWVLFIIFLLFKTPGLAIGMTLMIPVHLFISGLGIMKILEKMQRSIYAQFIAALIFSLSGYILTRTSFISMVWTFAWFPWIIFACIQLKQLKKRFPISQISQLSVLVALQLFAGHAQTTFYSLFLGGLIIIFYDFVTIRDSIKKLFDYLIAIIFSLLMAAIQILPTAEFLYHSQRSEEVGYEFASSLSVWPGRLITILFGNFWGNPNSGRFLSGGNFWEENVYLGVFTILLLTILVWTLFRKNRRNQIESTHKNNFIFLAGVLFFSVLFSLGKHFPLFPFLYKFIPGFDLFQAPSRFLIIYYFVICIFVGFGIDLWVRSKYNVRKTGIIFVAFGTLLVISFIMLIKFKNFPESMVYSLVIGSIAGILFAGLTILKDKTNLNISTIKTIMGFVIVIDLFYHNFLYENYQTIEVYSHFINQKNNSEMSRVFLNQEDESFIKFNLFYRPDRLQPLVNYEDYQPSFIPDTNLLNNRFAMINNFDPLQPAEFTEFWTWLNNLTVDNQMPILSMVGTQEVIVVDPEKNNFLSEEIIHGKELVQWYECTQPEIKELGLDQLLKLELSDADHRCLIVEGYSSTNENPELNQTTLKYLDFTFLDTNNIRVRYNSDSPGWIVIRQNYFPGWKVISDTSDTIQIEKVDYLFQGMKVSAGEHEIIVKYLPNSFLVGMVISIISIGLMIGFICYSRYRKSIQKTVLSELNYAGEENGNINS